MIDLHTHSTVSDGTDPPERIPELAASAGLRAVALTDHDSLEGLPAAMARAAEVGVELVAGCELSCRSESGGMHVLLYFVDPADAPLRDELVRLRSDRSTRNADLLARLGELGLPVTWADVVTAAGGDEGVIGRPHFAAALVAHGVVGSVQEAFDTWLSRGRPAYVPKSRLTPAEAARLARGAGGVAVLAHPFSLGLPLGALAGVVSELADAGFSGIEAHYGRYTPQQRRDLVDLARRAGLVPTGGSDYHGTMKPDLRVGTGTGDLSVPDRALEDLLDRRPA